LFSHPFNVPIAVIIFNRPDKTEKLLQIIRQVQPSQLFIIADGPRTDKPDDLERCKAARAIFETLDWNCQIFRNYANENLSCGLRPASGISWVFEHVEEAIILEDDCMPNLSFFQFCQELLEKYRNDPRVMHIAGSSYSIRDDQQSYSYVFSRYILCWGWATWRRAWQHYDFDMKKWDDLRETNFLLDILNGDRHAIKNWQTIFQTVYENHHDCWDYQWKLACWLQGGLSIIPGTNLVTNIGDSGTHTTVDNQPYLFKPSHEIEFPLRHPIAMVQNTRVDQKIQVDLYDWYPPLWKRVQRKLKKMLK
jgi:hypothetical protein